MDSMSGIRKPPPLRSGDQVGIFVPSSPIREPFRSRGLKVLRKMGLEPVEVPGILDGTGCVSKDPREAVADLQRFFHDGAIRALWAARGGYGANLALPYLDTLEVPETKVVVGSSDVSVLLWWLMEKRRMVVFYGPMAYASLADGGAEEDQCLALLDGSSPLPLFRGHALIEGEAVGRLHGGCLTNLVSLIGTSWFPNLEDRIVLLEDVGERPYRLHRLCWQLVQSRGLHGVRGIVLGEFPGCFNDIREQRELWMRLADLFSHLNIPVMTDLPLGHARRARTIPLGVSVGMNASASEARLRLLEPGTVSRRND